MRLLNPSYTAKEKTSLSKETVLQTLLLAAVFALLLCFLRHSALTAAAVEETLRRLLKTVLPSTFPYMVLSRFLLESLPPSLMGGTKQGAPLLCRLCHLPAAALPVLLLAPVAGFPVGASSTVSLYQRGLLTKDEAERLIAVSNFCGPPFLLSAVGKDLLGSFPVGLLLFAVQTLLSFLAAIFLGRKASASDCSNFDTTSSLIRSDIPRKPFSLKLYDSLYGAGLSTLLIASCVLFFGILSKLLAFLLQSFGAPLLLETFLCGFLEISVGTVSAADCAAHLFPTLRPVAVFLVSLTGVWSGFSVHMQVSSFALPEGLSLSRYYRLRCLLSPIAAALTALAVFLLPNL